MLNEVVVEIEVDLLVDVVSKFEVEVEIVTEFWFEIIAVVNKADVMVVGNVIVKLEV